MPILKSHTHRARFRSGEDLEKTWDAWRRFSCGTSLRIESEKYRGELTELISLPIASIRSVIMRCNSRTPTLFLLEGLRSIPRIQTTLIRFFTIDSMWAFLAS